MNLPKDLWEASYEEVTASIREGVRNFSKKIKDAYASGVGLYISGSRGCGKTGAAAVLLKEARAWGFSAYFVSVTQLREAIRNHSAFDGESSVAERCRTVDFLLLDDLRPQEVNEKFFTLNDIRNLIASRYDAGLPTFITAPVDAKAWREVSTKEQDARQIQDVVLKACARLTVTGDDRVPDRQSFVQQS